MILYSFSVSPQSLCDVTTNKINGGNVLQIWHETCTFHLNTMCQSNMQKHAKIKYNIDVFEYIRITFLYVSNWNVLMVCLTLYIWIEVQVSCQLVFLLTESNRKFDIQHNSVALCQDHLA